ncbi:hypothetical protein WJX75_007869 [Coccomyxa subellipsoidea]|uniref:Uncharacterized protein n=1 Tax=Coccomyxa subellipsoidea TaxID=248742 RepID=A0ABR2YNF1_9CHLO
MGFQAAAQAAKASTQVTAAGRCALWAVQFLEAWATLMQSLTTLGCHSNTVQAYVQLVVAYALLDAAPSHMMSCQDASVLVAACPPLLLNHDIQAIETNLIEFRGTLEGRTDVERLVER